MEIKAKIKSQFSSASQSCPTLCDPVNCSTPGLPVHHQLLELAQTDVHQVSDTMQPFLPPFSYLQSFPPSVTQLFSSGGQSIGASASVLPMSIQDRFPLGWTGLISLQSKGLSRVFSNTKSITSLAFTFLYDPTLTSIHDYWENHSFDHMDLCW